MPRFDTAVVGGGLSGMIAALELALAGEKVVLYESESSLGGFVRSTGQDQDFDEHSWRSFGDFYTNLQDICSMLGVPWPTAQTKLRPFPPVATHVTSGDLRMLWHLVKGMFMQNLKPLDATSWYDLTRHGASEWGLMTLSRFNKSGSDFHDLPAGTMIRLIEHLLPNRFGFRVSPLPSREYILEPLQRRLELLGVVIKLNTAARSLSPADLDAETTVSAIPPAAYAKLESNAALYPFAVSKMKNLALEARHQEISARIVFNRRLTYHEKISFDLHRSAWGLLILPCDAFHDQVPWSTSVWSVTLTYMRLRDRHGRLPTTCTRKELVESIMEQIMECTALHEWFLGAHVNLKEALESVLEVRIWQAWKEDARGYLVSDEVMPVNSFKESWSRPMAGSKLGTKVFLAGAHAGTGCHMWLMESAAEAGKRAAIAVLHSKGKDASHVFLDPHQRHPLRVAFLSIVGVLVGLLVLIKHMYR